MRLCYQFRGNADILKKVSSLYQHPILYGCCPVSDEVLSFLRLFFSAYPITSMTVKTVNTPKIPAYRLALNELFTPGTAYFGIGAVTTGMKSSFFRKAIVSFVTFSSPSGFCDTNGKIMQTNPIMKDKPSAINNGVFLISGKLIANYRSFCLTGLLGDIDKFCLYVPPNTAQTNILCLRIRSEPYKIMVIRYYGSTKVLMNIPEYNPFFNIKAIIVICWVSCSFFDGYLPCFQPSLRD